MAIKSVRRRRRSFKRKGKGKGKGKGSSDGVSGSKLVEDSSDSDFTYYEDDNFMEFPVNEERQKENEATYEKRMKEMNDEIDRVLSPGKAKLVRERLNKGYLWANSRLGWSGDICEICGSYSHHYSFCDYLIHFPEGATLYNQQLYELVCHCGIYKDGKCVYGCCKPHDLMVVQKFDPLFASDSDPDSDSKQQKCGESSGTQA